MGAENAGGAQGGVSLAWGRGAGRSEVNRSHRGWRGSPTEAPTSRASQPEPAGPASAGWPLAAQRAVISITGSLHAHTGGSCVRMQTGEMLSSPGSAQTEPAPCPCPEPTATLSSTPEPCGCCQREPGRAPRSVLSPSPVKPQKAPEHQAPHTHPRHTHTHTHSNPRPVRAEPHHPLQRHQPQAPPLTCFSTEVRRGQSKVLQGHRGPGKRMAGSGCPGLWCARPWHPSTQRHRLEGMQESPS